MSAIFGLDFGTTNSALSVNINGVVNMIDIDEFNTVGKTLRSVIYFDEEKKDFFVGQEAINHYIENDSFGRYMQSIKSFLPDQSFEHTTIDRRTYKLDDLIAIILRKIKERYSGETVDSVILGRPVVFSKDKKNDKIAEKRLKSAAIKAGFKNIYFQYEPIAAALAFENSLPPSEEKIVLVGDFGGGTSDFTIIKAKGGIQKKEYNHKEDVLSLAGVDIGGDTFDSKIMWEKVAKHFGRYVKVKGAMSDYWFDMPPLMMAKLRKWHLIPFLRSYQNMKSISEAKQRSNNPQLVENLKALVDGNYGFMLYQSIEKAKIELSSLEKTSIYFREYNLKIKEDITRIEFQKIIKNETERINLCVNNALAQAELTASEIDVVFLTGGSSFIPCIKEIFEEKFGNGKINQTNPFTSVAYGLGLTGGLHI